MSAYEGSASQAAWEDHNDRMRRVATKQPDPSAEAYAALPDDDVAALREEVERLSGWLDTMADLPSALTLREAVGRCAGLQEWVDERTAAQEQRRNDLRRSALAKLSAEEAEALGLDWKGVGKAGDDE